MSKREPTARQRTVATLLVVAGIAVVVAAGLLLREHAPGNMGNGFLTGAALAGVACVVALWRLGRDRASTFERSWLQQGDERDDAILTHALAVLGLLCVPLTGAAAVAISLGLHAPMVLTLLLGAQFAVLLVTFGLRSRSH